MTTPALIGLGSNLGDRKERLDLAVAALSGTPGVTLLAVSPYHETPPVGGPPGQGPFLNAAASVATPLEPLALLARLQKIENDAGRSRSVRWGERTLDLDLLLYGDLVLDSPKLRIPHPRMALRRFVLAPLAEIAPAALDPVTGRTVRELLANLDRRPSYVALACGLNWDPYFLLGRMPPTFIEKPGRLFEGDGVAFHDRICRELPAVSLEGRVTASVEERLAEAETFRDVLAGLVTIERAAAWLDADASSRLAPAAAWLVSHFWFDALFLGLDTLKSTRPRFQSFRERFLAMRARVVRPTFVVARPTDRERLGLHDPRYAWRHPIGRDTPLLLLDDFESDASLSEVLDTCSATRAG